MAKKRKEVRSDLTIEKADLVFANFSGKEGKYNREGQRNFCVLLNDNQAEMLDRDGWNVKWLEPREEGDERQAYLPVAVRFDNVPPSITMILPLMGKREVVTEDTVEMLDFVRYRQVDLIITPYNWEMNGKTGVKAYLKTMYVIVDEDPLMVKYANIPDHPGNCEGPDCDLPPWEE